MKFITSLLSLLLTVHLASGQTSSNTIDQQVDSLYQTLSETERVGQMIMVAAGGMGYGLEGQKVVQMHKQGYIGGVIYLGATSTVYKDIYAQLSKVETKVPLVYATDAEPALIPSKVREIKRFPSTNSIANVDDCKRVVGRVDSILKTLKVAINFAPVCDLTQENEAIGKRSFGNDANKVVELSSAFCIQSLQDGVLPVVKHFPGHGYVQGDSHKGLVSINGEMKELFVFQSMIERGAPSIMVGHIEVKNNAFNTNGLPSTCSKRIVTDLLRDSLKFDGLVFTDAMNMGAVVKIKDAPLLAAKAGCDVILMPEDPKAVVEAILAEMKKNEAFNSQIERSVKRILKTKLTYNH